MKRRDFLKMGAAAASGVLAARTGWSATKNDARPNILVLMADDMGYSDLSCFGSKEIRTPVLDEMAKQGMRFTDFHAPAPNCSPSRAAMLTGRFSSRVGMYSYVPPSTPMHLRTSEITTAELLGKSGYATAHVGKWHLGSGLAKAEHGTPGDHGFSHWLGTENNALPSHKDPVNFIRNGKELGKVKGYSCQIVADEAILWLSEIRDPKRPFFLNVWFHEPHAKVAAPEEMVARHKGQPNPAYLACVENMDLAVGRILAHLDKAGLAENTFVLFTSDNGSYRDGSNGIYRGKKSFVWEGGIREPTIVRWPGRIQPGTTCEEAACGVDVLPTLCEIAGIDPPGDRVLDGVSILPLFQGRPIRRSKPLYWFFYRTDPACAIRQDNWLLVGYMDEKVPPGHSFREEHMAYIRRSKPGRFELYNLKTDPSQRTDVAAANKKLTEKMRRTMLSLHAEVVEEGPLWY